MTRHSKITPNQGTLQVFPDVLLSNAYIILRPFFKPIVEEGLSEAELLDAKNWKFGASNLLELLVWAGKLTL